jgi:hypothetical protein
MNGRTRLDRFSNREDANPPKVGAALREPIFYAAESAYPSQYRDFRIGPFANAVTTDIRGRFGERAVFTAKESEKSKPKE